jgi:2-keto-4-pentenoate hydratase/2-oxohepta-3-ene-1,7-dioic acid hydratase in catechol pathway
MRLVTYSRFHPSNAAHLGVCEGDFVVDAVRAAEILGIDSKRRSVFFASMESLLGCWEDGAPLLRTISDRARDLIEGRTPAEGLEETFTPLPKACLHPPVVHPPTVRDFYSFETHVKNARARRGLTVPPEWYEAPVFYFSNPSALIGHDAPVTRPASTQALDYELEIACVIRKKARDVAPDDWRSVVAGFTMLNDWSARDVQRKEMAVGLGPAKGKDFATSLGPAIVTVDEFEDRLSRAPDGGERLDLAMEARVNGKTLSRANAKDMHFTFGQMIARASADVYLFPGDVIGSGTAGNGCILELGPETHRWLEPGDEVTLEIERLGELSNRIA